MVFTYLDALTGRLREALGPELRAVYLTGSAAVDAYRAGSSDIDVLVAVEDAARDRLDAVVARCAHATLPCPATKLELVVYETRALAVATARPRWSLNFDTGANTHHVGFDADAEPAHWFVLDLAFARHHARPLLGPPAHELIAEDWDAAVPAALEAMVEWYESCEPENAAVARARADHWLTKGTFAPKAGLPSDSPPP